MKKTVLILAAVAIAPAAAACTAAPASDTAATTSATGTTAATTSGTTTSATTSSGTAAASAAAPATTTSVTPGTVATCQPVSEADVAGLFRRWNEAVTSGDPDRVVENYAAESILVPTVSNQVRTTAAAKRDYFVHFLANKPTGVINVSDITLGCNMAVDSGLYTFTYRATGKIVPARYTFTYHWENGQWLIVSHHSSGMPEPVGAASSASGQH